MLRLGRAFLEKKGVDEARLDAELLVAHALGIGRLKLYLSLERPVETAEVDAARELLVRRAGGVPVAYLTGQREFYGRPFRVGPGVLVPRPETELLVDRARAWHAARGEAAAPTPTSIGELGAGSGCVAITLALELAGSRVTAVERSDVALACARENGRRLGAEVAWIAGDGTAALARACPDGLDLLVANPPYVDPAQAAELPREVRDHEPVEALFRPADDPEFWLRAMLDLARERVRPGGALLVELGADQADAARRLTRERGLEPRLVRDLAGVERVLEVGL